MGIKEGWMRCFGEAKWHYYGPGKGERLLPSLCEKLVTWKATGLQPGHDDRPDNCKECLRVLRERDTQKGPTLERND